MSELNRKPKIHWTETKVNDATKKINTEIYQRNRQAPIPIKSNNIQGGKRNEK